MNKLIEHQKSKLLKVEIYILGIKKELSVIELQKTYSFY